jgi:mRNA-degrading endonuclease RelE of RelBE toxin-antitoxin system
MVWDVRFTSKAKKQAKNLPPKVRESLFDKASQPMLPFGKLQAKRVRACKIITFTTSYVYYYSVGAIV